MSSAKGIFQYGVKIIIAEKYQLTENAVEVRIHVNETMLYPEFDLLIESTNDYVHKVLLPNMDKIKLELTMVLDKEQPYLTFTTQLFIKGFKHTYPEKVSKEASGNGSEAYDPCSVFLSGVPISMFMVAHTIVNPRVWRNMKLREIITDIVENKTEFGNSKGVKPLKLYHQDPGGEKPKGKFHNEEKYPEIFIPEMQVKDVIPFIDRYFGIYKQPLFHTLTFNITDGKAGDNDISYLLGMIPKSFEFKKLLDPITIWVVNTPLTAEIYNNPNKIVRNAKNKTYLTVGNPQIIDGSNVEGWREGPNQEYSFKPPEDLYRLIKNEYGQNAANYMGGDTVNYDSILNRTSYNKYLTMNGQSGAGERFNQWFVNYQDAALANSSVEYFVTLRRGVIIQHFLMPYRMVTIKSGINTSSMNGTYYIKQSELILSKQEDKAKDKQKSWTCRVILGLGRSKLASRKNAL